MRPICMRAPLPEDNVCRRACTRGPVAFSAGAMPTIAAASSVKQTIARTACRESHSDIQNGIPVARIELMDALQVKACNAYSKLGLPEAPLLILEFHGSADEVKAQASAVTDSNENEGFANAVRKFVLRSGAADHGGADPRASSGRST